MHMTATYTLPMLAKAQHLVLNAPRRISYAKMATEIGVSAKWISLLAKGKINNPGVMHVANLIAYLESVSSEG